jgi:hypothetical protein
MSVAALGMPVRRFDVGDPGRAAVSPRPRARLPGSGLKWISRCRPVAVARAVPVGRSRSLARCRSAGRGRSRGAGRPVPVARAVPVGRSRSLARCRSAGRGRSRGAGRPVAVARAVPVGRSRSLARCWTRRPSPRLVQLPEPRPTSGGPAASVSLQHGRHLRALRCRLSEGSRLPHYPPKHHAPKGPGFCGQLLTQLPVCSLSGCSGSCTRWGYLDSGPTCRPVRVFPGGRARECFPSLLDARSTARTLPFREHRCRYPKQHRCHRSLPCFVMFCARGVGGPPPEPPTPAAPPPPIPRAKPPKWRNSRRSGGRHLLPEPALPDDVRKLPQV